jgi:sugar phosphate isomerase/epimerase
LPVHARYSVCQFTTPDLTFEEDLDLYADTGAAGVGLCEIKLRAGEEDAQLEALSRSGLKAAVSIPANLGPLPCEPVFPGPADIDERVAAMCDSIRRLAPFEPEGIVVVTGSGTGRSPADARSIAIEGLREAARVAAEHGIRLSIEPLRTDGGLDLTLVSTIPETLALLEEVDAPNIDIAYDVYHLWDTPDILELTERHASSFGAVHVNDWRDPPRSVGDRLLPGDGAIDLPKLFAALEAGGFEGWYDLEIFSDKSFPDSLWNLPPRELVERGRDGFLREWNARAPVVSAP